MGWMRHTRRASLTATSSRPMSLLRRAARQRGPQGRGWSRVAGPGEGVLPAVTSAGGTPALTRQDAPTASIDPEHLTSPGTALGTVAYMSPEQARREKLDARTDLFSFGAVLYEMATGRPAFDGTTNAMIFHQTLGEAPESPIRLNPSLPSELDEIISKALEKDHELRYQHASEVRADLKRLKRDKGWGRPVVPGPSPAERVG